MALTAIFHSACGDQFSTADLPLDWSSIFFNLPNISVVPGYSGNALRFASASTPVAMQVPAVSIPPTVSFCLGVRIFVPAYVGPTLSLVEFNSAGSTQPIILIINPNGSIGLGDQGTSATEFVTAAGALPVGAWSYVEIYFPSGLSGSNNDPAHIYINGVSAASGNLTHSSNFVPPLTVAAIGIISNTVNGISYSFDDFYMIGNSSGAATPLGPQVVSVYTGSSAGASTQWTPLGSVNNWQNAATIPPGAPTIPFNETQVVNNIDDYATMTLRSGPVPATINAAKVTVTGSQQVTGRSIAIGVTNGVTSSYPAFYTPPMYPNFNVGYAEMTNNPITAAPWVPADLATLQLSIKLAT